MLGIHVFSDFKSEKYVFFYFIKIENVGQQVSFFYSPVLFNLYSKVILRELQYLSRCIISIGSLNSVHYTYDRVLMANSEDWKNYYVI